MENKALKGKTIITRNIRHLTGLNYGELVRVEESRSNRQPSLNEESI